MKVDGLFVLYGIAAALFTVYSSQSETQGNPEAVKEVMSGKRKEAKASWWGFDPVDATSAVQSAIDSGASRVIIENMGAPWVVDRIQLAGDQEILFEKGVVVIARKGAFRGKGDSLFSAALKKNVTLTGYGATLKMHKADYAGEGYEKAEWRHVLSICSCSNVRVYGLTLAESGGDGIYLGVAQAGVTNTDIHIKDVVCDANYRQGISVISAENLLIENCVLKNTSGTAPSSGIDYEPNLPDEKLVNCVMRNCVSENNRGDGFELYLENLNAKSADVSVRIENCCSIGNNAAVRCVIGNGPDAAVKGLIEFINCTFKDSRNAGIVIGDKPARVGRIRFVNCTFSDLAVSQPGQSPIIFGARPGCVEDLGGVEFVNCIVRDPVERAPVSFLDQAGGLRVLDVTGTLTVERNGKKTVSPITPERPQ